MANAVTKFIDPAGNYTGGYTSNMIEANQAAHRSNATRGVIQADVEANSSVSLQMRLTVSSRWIEVAVYTEDTIEEVVMAKFTRVVVSGATGAATVWLGETK